MADGRVGSLAPSLANFSLVASRYHSEDVLPNLSAFAWQFSL